MHARLHLLNVSQSDFLLKYHKFLGGEITQNLDYPKKFDRLFKRLDSYSCWLLNLVSCIIIWQEIICGKIEWLLRRSEAWWRHPLYANTQYKQDCSITESHGIGTQFSGALAPDYALRVLISETSSAPLPSVPWKSLGTMWILWVPTSILPILREFLKPTLIKITFVLCLPWIC